MKVCIETLGCKVNTYESEVMKNIFGESGFEIVDIHNHPDVVVINTCTVTNQSDAKSRKIIRGAKRLNPRCILIVTGCMAQLHQDEIKDLGIDILIGNKDKSKILDLLNEYLTSKKTITKFYDLNVADFEDMDIHNFIGRTRAFVKIQDGCNNYCSYCIIPYVRGRIRNKDIDIAVEEIQKLVSNDYKEIVLTGIHTGSYGTGTDYNLVTLIKRISKIKNLARIRISSIEVTELNEEFLNELKINSKICDHLHIPLQSGSNPVLKKMNRKYDVEYFKNKIKEIRSIRPDINITTDIIVGFPTETDEDFENTIKTATEIGFGKIHVFPYSKRDGTVAATFKNIVPSTIKKERSKRLIALSNALEQKYYQKFLGKRLRVLIEETHNDYVVGHTSNYIKVMINKKLLGNEFYDSLITEIDKEHVQAV
ncbi:MAG: tRNA (N(6)-L-threonylcarbamoyladenosine(37)-C(2))-methylthiotransferase MtaB [Mollicutes bacterium]|jgi:threonylcarbamoyladenosine tRNA methylthiotransferase MtaB|nr:tRNA (N(6)-L-threonylcarbamoyladenosine(37)-C(2))-methylthiotransferase MtaB [Mollicutes bacterium]